MAPDTILSFRKFLWKQKKIGSFNIVDYYESRGVKFCDKENVERLIKATTEDILKEESDDNVVLKEICEDISAGNYLVLRSEKCDAYWQTKRVCEQSKQFRSQIIDDQIDERRSKRLKSKNALPNENDSILNGFVESVGTMIKRHAHQVYMDNKFSHLGCDSKNVVSNGFNSIVDLTDNKDNDQNQKSLFSPAQWGQLIGLWHQKINWKPLQKHISDELKKIEKLAEEDLKAAYKLSLQKQIDYAFTPDESCLKVYSSILSMLNSNIDILSYSNKAHVTEQDYVIKVWAPIISAIFDDSNLFCKWGDSVYEESTKARKISEGNDSGVGDKVDARICTRGSDGKTVDLINIEFANNTQDQKYQLDHRKLLRESKVIADRFYRSPFLKKRYKRNIKIHSIQVAGVEGQIINVGLVDNGLYASTKMGSLRLPTSALEIRKARTLLERLFHLKNDAEYLAQCYSTICHERETKKKNMDLKQNHKRSPYDEDENDDLGNNDSDKYCIWIRGTWFPPSNKKEQIYNGQYPNYLFEPPPLES